MVTIADVAQRAGVSVATVSRALRGLSNVAPATRAKVMAAAQELDYVGDPSAARLAAGRTATVGVVLPGLGAWFHATLMAALHETCHAEGFDLLALVIATTQEHADFMAEMPFRKRVDGLLVVDVPFSEEQYTVLTSRGVPVVTTGIRAVSVPSVGIDDRLAARGLAEHLVALGHRDIATIEGDLNKPFRFPGTNARLQGFLDGFNAGGVTIAEERRVTTGWDAASGAWAMQHLLDTGSVPTAIVAFSDELAMGALGLLRRAGISVPEEVSVVGFDGHELAEHVDLTTVEQPVAELGAAAGRLLLSRIRSPHAAAEHLVLATRMRVRGTTAPPRRVRTTPLTAGPSGRRRSSTTAKTPTSATSA